MIDLRVLSSSYQMLDILDNFAIDSIIWVERYNKEGDFEIYAKFSFELLDLLQKGNYIVSKDSDRVMIIETTEIKTDVENGNKLVVTGRTIESLLDRRIILRQIQINTSFQSGIQAILNADVINSIYPERNFPNFVFSTSTDPAVTAPTLVGQFYSQNLLETIKTLCYNVNLGFKLVLNASNQMVFSLYAGKNRSYDQSTYPYIVFSPEFENLISSNYFSTNRYRKNYVLVSGDPTGLTGLPKRVQVWTADVGTGLNRLEMFSDARDLPRYVEGTSTPIDDTTYGNQLTQRGWEELGRNDYVTAFDGQVKLGNTYKYGTDFQLGDIVQLMDAFGHSAKVRVTEMTISEDVNNGYNIYPTLETL